jgi:hypothetical protein
MFIYVDRYIHSPVSKTGDKTKEQQFMLNLGQMSSGMEHGIFEQLYKKTGTSAVKALSVANSQGIPIYTINTNNIANVLPQLQISSEVKNDIQNAVNANKVVTVSKTNVTIDTWTGVGYILLDQNTGAGAYMISGGLAGGSSTKNADGWQIVRMFKGALGWFLDALDVYTRGSIAYAAQIEMVAGGLSDEEIQIRIIQGTMVCSTYELIGKCTGLVINAYEAAGIYLVKLAKDNGTGHPAIVKNLKALAVKLDINNNRVRKTNNPLIGDIIFWDNTWDANGNCAADDELTHTGIVQEADVAVNGVKGIGTIKFVHASSSKDDVVHDRLMNIDYKSNPAYNSPLRTRDKPSCWTCSSGENCPGTTTGVICEKGTKPYTCTEEQWDSVPKRAGELFNGYATIRNP